MKIILARCLMLFFLTGTNSAFAQDEIEKVFWESIACDNQMEISSYIETYPNGFYLADAERCLAVIGTAEDSADTSEEIEEEDQNKPSTGKTKVDERIDEILQILNTGSDATKIETLERLQWSGTSDPRLFDVVESYVLERYQNQSFTQSELKIFAHHIRALGYSGNNKYQSTLSRVSKEAASVKVPRYAKKALQDLDRFGPWVALIENNSFEVEGKSAAVTMYMRMLNVDNVIVQRLAARAIFHERQNDQDLLLLTADKLKAVYLRDGLDRQAQDTAAWFCKAIGQSGKPEFTKFLKTVSENTPHKGIKKHAVKFLN